MDGPSSAGLIWRAIKEPAGLLSNGGKRPDGRTLVIRHHGKPLTSNVTVTVTTYNLSVSAIGPGGLRSRLPN